MRFFGPACVMLLASLPAALRAETRLLIAVGDDRGLADEPALRHARRDARRVARLLSEIGGVAPGAATVLENPRLDALERALEALGQRARGERDPTVLLYFSGHGDAEHLHLGGQRYPLARLRQRLGAIPAAVRLLLIDACRSDRGQRPKGIHLGDRPFAISLSAPTGPRGLVIVQSSSAGEAAQESDRLGGAVFTHFLLAGLRGGADVNGDQQVTLDEAYAHAYQRTLQHSAQSRGPVQRPAREIDLRGAGPLVLTRIAAARAQLVLPPGRDVHYLVYAQPAGSLIAEAWSPAQRPLVLALPRGRFLVQRRDRTSSGAREVALPYGGRRELADGDFTPVPAEVLARKGGALTLHHHRLELGYALRLPDTRIDSAGHRLRLHYAHRLGAWLLGGALVLGLDDRDTEQLRIDERSIGAELVARRGLLLGPLLAHLGGGGGLRAIHQRRRSRDADRLQAAGYPVETDSNTALAGGPLAEAGIALPLGERAAFGLALRGELLLLREAGDLTADFTADLGAFVRVAF